MAPTLRRAAAVRDELVKRRIASERLVVKGLADRNPVDGSKTESQRQHNRRVSFRLIGGDAGAP